MAAKVYTFAQICVLWDGYKSLNVLRCLVDGKWEIEMEIGVADRVKGTRAERVKASMVMSFPEYLERMKDA